MISRRAIKRLIKAAIKDLERDTDENYSKQQVSSKSVDLIQDSTEEFCKTIVKESIKIATLRLKPKDLTQIMNDKTKLYVLVPTILSDDSVLHR